MVRYLFNVKLLFLEKYLETRQKAASTDVLKQFTLILPVNCTVEKCSLVLALVSEEDWDPEALTWTKMTVRQK